MTEKLTEEKGGGQWAEEGREQEKRGKKRASEKESDG